MVSAKYNLILVTYLYSYIVETLVDIQLDIFKILGITEL